MRVHGIRGAFSLSLVYVLRLLEAAVENFPFPPLSASSCVCVVVVAVMRCAIPLFVLRFRWPTENFHRMKSKSTVKSFLCFLF